jgi:two-component system chemotaxis response regulator CheY
MSEYTINTHDKQKLKKIHILIVISSYQAADLIKQIFENIGFKSIYIAYSAIDAISLLKTVRVHIIVADAELETKGIDFSSPSADDDALNLMGVKFMRSLRHSLKSPAPFTPILILIDSPNSEAILAARDAGVNEIIVKPIEAKVFFERIINLIDKPRIYITADTYKGPCRRRKDVGPPSGMEERRKRDIRVITCNELRGYKS